MVRYALIILTLAAAVAFALSIAVEARWIGAPASATFHVASTASVMRATAMPTATLQPTRASILAYYFAGPTDVSVSPTGHVFVADTLNDRVVQLGRAGTQFPSWGSHALHRTSMKQPSRVLPLASGFFVIDRGNTQVARFSSDGRVLARWSVDRTIGAMTGPTDLALDPFGSLYLADGNNDRIARLSASGHILSSWSTRGFLASAEGGPNDPGYPAGMAIDRLGKIYVAYPNAGAVQKFSSTGVPIDKWQLPNRGAAASDVAVDGAGNVYVVDSNRATVTKFGPTGPVMATWGGRAGGKGRLLHPTAIAVDTHGFVFVTDAGNSKVGSFVKEWTSSGKYVRTYAFG